MREEMSKESDLTSRESTPEPPKPNKWKLEVDKDDIREVSLEEMQNLLKPPDDQLRLSIDGMPRLSDVRSKANPEASDFCHYFNRLSQFVRGQLAPQDYTLKFRATIDGQALGHPNDMEDYPNILIVREYPEGGPDDAHLHWSHLEGIGMMYSGKSEQIASARAASCTAVHLQARPDLLMSLGILVKANYFKLFAVNACAVHQSPRIPWVNDAQYRSLLCAWMYRFYSPDVDSLLTINYTLSQPPTFTLVQDGQRYSGLAVLHAGDSIGRRTIVMHNPDHGDEIVVKEQYVEKRRKFKEEHLLKKIHKTGSFPGVISLVQDSPSSDTGLSVTAPSLHYSGNITKHKIRLLLNEKGRPLSTVKTPEEVLMALYDALEVSRILFKHRGVFHRDLSQNNILLRDGIAEYTGPLDHNLGDMCFSQYLLDSSTTADDISSDSSRRHRLATNLLLIDFDCAEDLEIPATSTQNPKSPVGTPIFMARRVRDTHVLTGFYMLPAIPQLEGEIAERFQRILPERLKAFPPNESQVEMVLQTKDLTYNCHHLHFEAESIFWNLFTWCVTAQPAVHVDVDSNLESQGFRVTLACNEWSSLVGESDIRDQSFISCRDLSRAILHPAYSSLYELLDAMREYLEFDLEFSQDPVKREPDYLHEVFQRLIISFLFKNRGRAFMELERALKGREVRWGAMGGEASDDTSASMTSDQSSTRSSEIKRSTGHLYNDGEDRIGSDVQRSVKRIKSSHGAEN